MSEWDERVYEAVGYGISSPETPESENYFAGEAPKLVNWHFYLKTHSRRKGRYSASVTVSFLPIVEAYLVDGHVIFSDGVERKSQGCKKLIESLVNANAGVPKLKFLLFFTFFSSPKF